MFHKSLLAASTMALLLASTPGGAQTAAPAKDSETQRKADAYYNFSMGHLYAELAAAYGSRSDYVEKAIEHYKAAMTADPKAAFLTEELTDLYVQSGRLREAVTEAEDMLKRNPDNLDARRMLGRIYSRMIGDTQQNRINEDMVRRSVEQFEKVVAKDPKDSDSWLMLGRLYKLQQHSPEAEKAYQKVLEIDPDNEYAMYGLAGVYSDVGDSKRAVDMWKKLAEQNPNPRSYRQLAEALKDAHDLKGQVEALRKAQEIAPKDPEIKGELADALLMSDQTEEALKLYTELSAADPKNPQYALRLAQIYRDQHDLAKARAAQDKAKSLDAGNIEIRYNEVKQLEAEGKANEAINQLKDLLQLTARPNYDTPERTNRVILLDQLGRLYSSIEQYPQAIATFEQIAQLDPGNGARASALIIDTYRSAKDFKKAEQAAEAAVKKYPEDRTVRMIRANLLADLGRVDEAAAEVKKAMGGKSDRETWIALAQIYDKGKRYEDVGKALDEAEKLSRTPDEETTIHFLRGAMYEKLKRNDEAEGEFRKVLDKDPQNASAMNYLGYMLAERNVRLQEAHKLVSKALELEPNNGAYLDSLGWVYFRMGRYQEAENATLASLEKVARDPTVHDHLGDIYFQQGKLKEAIGQWEISLREWDASSQADQDSGEMAKIHKKLEGAKVRLAKESGRAAR